MYRKVLAMLLVVCMVICLAPAAFAFVETATIGDMPYRTLASAIEAAQDGDTITVTNDCVLSEGVTIPADLTVTLDLNGKVVRGVDTSATSSALITNNGNLTIKDSTAATDAAGTYVSGKLTTEPVNPDTASIPGYASNTITNHGTLTVLSGIIENTATGGACYAIDNYAGSTANINGGKIVTAKTALRMYSWQGTGMKVSLNITDGTVESNAGYGLTTQLAAGDNFDLNISGGSISTSRTDYKLAVYVNPNGSIADSSINISGGTFGGEFAMKAIACTSMTADNVSISGGSFEGVSCYEAPAYAFISGGTFGTEPDAAYIAEGYEAVYDESVDAYVVAPIAPVASIGSEKYTSLEDAVKAAVNGDTIVVLRGISLDGTITIPADLTVTLDLNGYTVTGSPAVAAAYSVITNYGNLTVADSSSAGTGKLLCDHKLPASTSYAVNTIVNAGSLTVTGGTIENTSTGATQIGYAIDNNSTSYNVSTTITGGTVTASGSGYYDGIRLFCNNTTKTNSVTVNGGAISSIWLQNPSDGSTKNTKDVVGSVSVTDGKIGCLSLEPSANFSASVTGGTFTEVSYFQHDTVNADRNLTAFISGGTFATEPDAAHIAEGYEAVKDESANVYVVSPIAPVASIGGETYTSLEDAVKAAVNGDAIMILSDISLEETITIPADLTVTLDLNGYTVSMVRTEPIKASHTMILNKGDLTITDSGEAGKLSYKFDTTADRAWAYAVTTISNQQGCLTVLDGTIESLSTATNVYKFTIDSLTNGQGGTAMLEIKGGKITAAKGGPIRGFANSTTCPNIINISGGEMVGQVWMQDPNTKANLGMLNITGGTITSFMDNVDAVYFLGDGDASGFDIYIGGDVVVNGTTYLTSTNTTAPFRAKIENGTFNDAVYCCTWEDDENYTNIPAICGGAFKQEPEASNLQPGFIAVFDDSTDMYLIKTAFADVVAGSFYEQPAIWAASNGITNGTSDTTFSPDAGCTRGQIVTFLWRACGEPEATDTACGFTDVNPNAFYYDAMLWAVENGITTGTSATTFSPNNICSRAEAVTFIWRACGKPAAENATCNFTDVNPNAFYYNAMLFCVENKITTGISSTAFGPALDCTRGQIVTFLWRCDNA